MNLLAELALLAERALSLAFRAQGGRFRVWMLRQNRWVGCVLGVWYGSCLSMACLERRGEAAMLMPLDCL